MAGWLLNAVFQAALMFAMVMFATQAIYSDRSSGTTFSHWEVTPGSPSCTCSQASSQIGSYLSDATPSRHGDARLYAGHRKPSSHSSVCIGVRVVAHKLFAFLSWLK